MNFLDNIFKLSSRAIFSFGTGQKMGQDVDSLIIVFLTTLCCLFASHFFVKEEQVRINAQKTIVICFMVYLIMKLLS
ncbi:hypothetical protein ACRPLZ_00210 [Streptococcus uberis]|uniref:hypothetical protein n=1 Tax=Streptococcus uberis TaxID=1349 RepID=UPI0012B51CC6|nr:hypothetical protein [Streptococcus uberis]MTB69242.1 hypothetical protein [Streptococcus uberis]